MKNQRHWSQIPKLGIDHKVFLRMWSADTPEEGWAGHPNISKKPSQQHFVCLHKVSRFFKIPHRVKWTLLLLLCSMCVVQLLLFFVLFNSCVCKDNSFWLLLDFGFFEALKMLFFSRVIITGAPSSPKQNTSTTNQQPNCLMVPLSRGQTVKDGLKRKRLLLSHDA